MDSRFPIAIPIYDYNIESSTNLRSDYFQAVRLLSLPSVGDLFTSDLTMITEIPEGGLFLVNSTLFYQPPLGFFHASLPYVFIISIPIIMPSCTSLTLQLINSYGTSTPKELNIFVDWVNHPPSVISANYTFASTDLHETLLEIVDSDGDKNYTHILSVSPSCQILYLPEDSILPSRFQYTIQYIGQFNSTEIMDEGICDVLLQVVDSGGLQSEIAVIHYTIVNTLLPSTTIIQVWENQPTRIHLHLHLNASTHQSFSSSELSFALVQGPRHGRMSSSYPFTYVPDVDYFSDPAMDYWGNPIGNENDTFSLYAIHRGLRSVLITIEIIVKNINTIPM